MIGFGQDRYIDEGDGTVFDSLTGLMWTKNANLGGQMVWSNAVSYCEGLNVGGYADWRLPSMIQDGGVAELDTLGRVGGLYSGAWEGFEGSPFDGIEPECYWSCVEVVEDSNMVWVVRMENVGLYCSVKSNPYFVWAVRTVLPGDMLALSLGRLQEVCLWGFKGDLWIWGGICGIICAVCFFARS